MKIIALWAQIQDVRELKGTKTDAQKGSPSARPPRTNSRITSGRSPGSRTVNSRAELPGLAPSHALHSGVLQTLYSLTVAGAALALFAHGANSPTSRLNSTDRLSADTSSDFLEVKYIHCIKNLQAAAWAIQCTPCNHMRPPPRAPRIS